MSFPGTLGQEEKTDEWSVLTGCMGKLSWCEQEKWKNDQKRNQIRAVDKLHGNEKCEEKVDVVLSLISKAL